MKTITKNKPGLLLSAVKERCPHCGAGQVFEKNRALFQIPSMKEECSECKYRFCREPGYFMGAMYISYALAVAEGAIAFLICHLGFPAMDTIWKPVIMILAISLFAKKNFKLSRVLYIHLFPW